jgi:phosphoglycerate dehydrogenase-like enzyme
MKSPGLSLSLPDPGLIAKFGEPPAGVEVIEWDFAGPGPRDTIDIVVPPYMSSPEVLRQLAGVSARLVQSQSVGYDGVSEFLPPGYTYANAASVHETSTAELALALILASQRGLADFVRSSERGHWSPRHYESLADRSVLLVGYGGVGQAIESRLLPFETSVTRVATTARSDERGQIHGVDSLFDLLPAFDIVVVCVPLTPDTTHLVDDRFLSCMRDGGLLVNIARGRVASTEALLKHAQGGRLRFALDVTDPEPLPDGHPLFSLANVLISPHVGGASSAMLPRMARLVAVQAARMLNGEPPINVVLRS